MDRNDIHEAIGFFFDVIDGNYQPEDRENKLALALDQLALAYHFAEYVFDETDHPEASRREYEVIREHVSERFPDLGFYNGAHHISERIADSETNVGDSIDDICDIVGDLEEVLWCWDNTSIDDALWHFRFGYETHWGKHLRDLQLYLYAKQRGW